MQQKVYQLSGYMPPECACKIEDKLKKIEGVEDVSTDALNGVVQITYTSEHAPHMVQAALKKCGHECHPMEGMAMEHEDHEMHKGAHWLTIIAITVGLGTFLVWYFALGAEFVFALTLAITVIVIACPHALGLAIPTVTSISITLAARNGIMVKKPDALQQFLKIDTVVFDKTGTLTEGNLAVQELWSPSGEEDKLLSLAASLESNSEHIIGKGIVSEAEKRRIEYPEVERFEAVPGKGAIGVVGGAQVVLGNRKLMEQENVELSQYESEIDRRAVGRL